jgi:hypothetical protein
MITWTDSARETLDQHNRAQHDRLIASGADPDEVAADLVRHVEEELTAAKIHIATCDDVQRVLLRMGAPMVAIPDSGQSPQPHRLKSWAIPLAVVACSLVLSLTYLLRTEVGPKPATMSIQKVVRMTLAGEINPDSTIAPDTSGGRDSVVITGSSTKELNNGKDKTSKFLAHGYLSDESMQILQRSGRFAERPETNALTRAMAWTPLVILVITFGVPIALIVLLFKLGFAALRFLRNRQGP